MTDLQTVLDVTGNPAPAAPLAPETPPRGDGGRFVPKLPDTRKMTRDEKHARALADLEGSMGVEPVLPMKGAQSEEPAKTQEPQREQPQRGEKTTSEPPATKAESEGVKKGTEEDANALQGALTALRRGQVPKDIIDGLSKERVLQWGNELAKHQKSVDVVFAEHAELKKATPAKPANGEVAPAAQPPKLDLKALAKPIAEATGDEALGDAFVRGAEQIIKPLADELAESRQTNQMLAGVLSSMLERDARNALSERFTQLKDPAKAQLVSERMHTLLATGHYGNDPLQAVHAAMSDACKIVLDDDISRETRSRIDEDQARKANAALTVSTRPHPPASKSRDDQILGTIENLLQTNRY